MDLCKECNGSGMCTFCDGTGRISINPHPSNEYSLKDGSGTSKCYVCNGTGKCDNCNGSGRE